MKCIESCGYSHKPDNTALLTNHVNDCLTDGACSHLTTNPVVVWRGGEFVVVETPEEGERIFDNFHFHKKTAIELTERLIKTEKDLYVEKPQVSMGKIDTTVSVAKKSRKKDEDSGL